MSKQFKLDGKALIPIGTFLLFGIGGLKILLFGERYNLAVYNYISFPNLLEYSFDILRGLMYSAIPVLFFLVLKDEMIPFLKKPKVIRLAVALLLVSTLIVIYCYKIVMMTFWTNFWLKYLLEFGIFCAGIVIKSRKFVKNFEIVKLALLVCFLYGFVKIESVYVIHTIDKGKTDISKIVVKKNDNKDSTIFTSKGNYIVLTTPDFVFMYNDTSNFITAIPMANIYLFTSRIGDSEKGDN